MRRYFTRCVQTQRIKRTGGLEEGELPEQIRNGIILLYDRRAAINQPRYNII